MTRNQRIVLRWLREHCSDSGFIKVSNQDLASVFGWSQPYGKKILSSLVEQGHLEERQKGAGHRATTYHVPPSSHNQSASSHNQVIDSQQVQKDYQKKFAPFRYVGKPRNTQGESAQTIAHVQNIFDTVSIRVRKPVKTRSSPFKRFRERCDTVEKWNSTDFVCYFSFVHKVRFGETPTLEWSKECGAARTLLRRIGDPVAFKAFIQIAFAICKKPPNGLYTFSFGSFYETVINREIDEAILDEYDDEYVYPWLKLEMMRRSREAALEYRRDFVRRQLGL